MMPRMRPRALHLFTLCWLALHASTYFVQWELLMDRGTNGYGLFCGRGTVSYDKITEWNDTADKPTRLIRHVTTKAINRRTAVRFLGFGYDNVTFHKYDAVLNLSSIFQINVPLWPMSVTLVGLASGIPARLRRRNHERQARRGLCPACGYDLRASPGRCPECGAASARTAVSLGARKDCK